MPEAIEGTLDESLLVDQGLHGLAEVGLGKDRPDRWVVEVEHEVGDAPAVPNGLLVTLSGERTGLWGVLGRQVPVVDRAARAKHVKLGRVGGEGLLHEVLEVMVVRAGVSRIGFELRVAVRLVLVELPGPVYGVPKRVRPIGGDVLRLACEEVEHLDGACS